MKKSIKIIVAYGARREIGLGNEMPWRLPEELAWVSKTTRGVTSPSKRNAIIMGRKTWESIPQQIRPLKHRLNVVVTSSAKSIHDENDDLTTSPSFYGAIEMVRKMSDIETIFIFGGATLYQQALDAHLVDQVLATEIDASFEADTYFPKLPNCFVETSAVGLRLGGLVLRRGSIQ